jgi:hypothetical protein
MTVLAEEQKFCFMVINIVREVWAFVLLEALMFKELVLIVKGPFTLEAF